MGAQVKKFPKLKAADNAPVFSRDDLHVIDMALEHMSDSLLACLTTDLDELFSEVRELQARVKLAQL